MRGGRLRALRGDTAAVLGGAVVLVGVALVLPEPAINDWPYVHVSGENLLSGENPYGSRLLVGPLALVLAAVVDDYRLAAVLGALLLTVALRRVGGPARRTLAVTAVAAVPWCAGGASGHLDDQVATALLVLAVTSSGVTSGLLLSLASASKPFALIALPVVDRRAAAVTAVSGAVGLAFFLVVLDGAWLVSEGTTVQSGSPLFFVLPHNEPLPDWWRLSELAALLVVALLASRRVDPLRAVLAVAAVRLILEPGDFVYYGATLACLAGCIALRDGRWWSLGLSWVVMLGVGFPAPAVVRLAALLAIVCVELRVRWSGCRPLRGTDVLDEDESGGDRVHVDINRA